MYVSPLTRMPSRHTTQNATLTYDGRLFDVKHDLYILIQTDQKDDIEIRIIPMELIRKVPKAPPEEESDDGSGEDDDDDDNSVEIENEGTNAVV